MSSGIRIAGVWEKKSTHGKIYYEGSWGNVFIRIYANDYKKDAKDPDCVVYLSAKPKDDRRQAPSQPGKPFNRPKPNPEPTYKDHTKTQQAPPQDEAPWPTEEDIPF